MSVSVPIGEFSRLTHLSVKMLRHYHEIGLLEPAEVDATTSYRRYGIGQVPTALLIARLRHLDMPLPEIATVVRADSEEARNAIIADHLRRMEEELDRTREIVGSLRRLLSQPRIGYEFRSTNQPEQRVAAIVDRVDRSVIDLWCAQTFPRLYESLGAAGIAPIGPGAATYDDSFFTDSIGEVVAYVPIPTSAPPGLRELTLPAGRFATTVHHGSFTDIDRTYAALGSYVAERETLAPGPVRELYLVGPGDVTDPADYTTELCWPIAG
ncbi:MerR family transcriptional regulator [Microlunatus parietis]|uniref:DNA-binding transcriptional MerR regulator/predicted transcriptional regulator YdeE n=1 Tax=Microlunatus parietis TaxID=682979 RepID=A0A7Y9I9J9_9ACTN|nr:MerR family transcriptional regulator [Microlunatus parietis]NYE72595.1 DNA-binding transcriptional MerR regulator/predicted transcriptional regulator YdeE [Microlunatus parietis]